MRLRDRRTGAIVEPRSESVARMMAADPNYEALDAPKKAPARRSTRRKTKGE